MATVPRLFERVPAIQVIARNSSHQQSWLVKLFRKIPPVSSSQQNPSPSKLRIRVLRRDRYRCRACDRKGDEITLCVYSMHPYGSDVDECLALCSGCVTIAKSVAVEAESIPELLRILWHRLHSPRSTPAHFLNARHMQSQESQTA